MISEETHDLFCRASSQGETLDLFCRVPFVVLIICPVLIAIFGCLQYALFILVVHNVMLYMCNYLLCSTFHQSSFKDTDRNAYICLLLSLL